MVTSKESDYYRRYLPDLGSPRFTTMAKQDAHVYAKAFMEGGNPPWIHALWRFWLDLLKEPFKGVTNDGKLRAQTPSKTLLD
jgi:hypothetical protein